MQRSKPDIVFIVLDTHRVDRLGCYGYPRGTTPNLDAFTERATLFEHAISPAQWTIPVHASLFSGEYPSTHGTIQAADALSDAFPTLAELLQREGYQTTGFCNNPLVGVLENGLRRGFEAFYNYGGAIPSPPATDRGKASWLLTRLRGWYRKLLNQVAQPIQQAVAASPTVFGTILNPSLVSLWTRHANFKGDTRRSIRDMTRFLGETHQGGRPQFVFLNLMEPHLPYTPPERFTRQFAPIVKDEKAASDFINRYNKQALRWLLPLEQPLSAIEAKTLHDMYDAEVAYQDHLLATLLAELDRPEWENTMVAIASDHGEMLGEHNIMGHGLGAYQELVHVPLMIRFPGQKRGRRVDQRVSTRSLFHTVLAAADVETVTGEHVGTVQTSDHNLERVADPGHVYSEAYPPDNMTSIMEKHAPALLDAFAAKANRWAVYNHVYKLIRVEGVRDDLFSLVSDPGEMKPLDNEAELSEMLGRELDAFLADCRARRPEALSSANVDLEDEEVVERLRGLGYLE
jgi:uncharacterized sulfatase